MKIQDQQGRSLWLYYLSPKTLMPRTTGTNAFVYSLTTKAILLRPWPLPIRGRGRGLSGVSEGLQESGMATELCPGHTTEIRGSTVKIYNICVKMHFPKPLTIKVTG